MSDKIPSIGENIKSIRIQKGITQKDLAIKIGKSYSSIQKYELDLAIPPLPVVERLADALGVDKFEIYGWNEFEFRDEKSPAPEGTEDEHYKKVVSALTSFLGEMGWLDSSGDISDGDRRFIRSLAAMLNSYFEERG